MKIQVALDFFTIEEAVSLAEVVAKAGADWLEVGNPLIYSQGFKAVEVLKERFPDRPILVDFKAMDGAGFYIKEVSKKGADIATVMAVAPDGVIRGAVKACRETGVKLVVDLLGTPEDKAPERARQIEKLGADFVMVHTSLDAANENPSLDPIKILPSVIRAVNVPVCVACFTTDKCLKAKKMGASVAVVGPFDMDQQTMLDFIKAATEG